MASTRLAKRLDEFAKDIEPGRKGRRRVARQRETLRVRCLKRQLDDPRNRPVFFSLGRDDRLQLA